MSYGDDFYIIGALFTGRYPKRSIILAESRKYSHRQNRAIIVISYNAGALDMLMLSNRHLDPCDCFSLASGKKFGEMKILPSF